MKYGADVLRKDAAFYTFNNAVLQDGSLWISAGGSVSTKLTINEIAELTEWFRIGYIANKFVDYYSSQIRIIVRATLESGEKWSITGFPVNNYKGVYLQEFQAIPGKYTELEFIIESEVSVVITLWELCPEASEVDAQSIIDGISQSLPKLLYDYNTFPLAVDQAETVVGVISCRLIQDTDLQGHFAITFQASEVTTVVVRFYDNEGEELFAPMYYDCNVGHNTIGIPHSYLKRKSGPHSFVVTMQAYAGVLSIGTRDILFTIDGGYLAARELELAMDIMDLSIMQLESSVKPDEIWVIGKDKGKLLVRKRAYEEDNANVGWTAVADMGPGKHASIEFDGVWALRDKDEKFTIYTEEEPFMFLVSEEGVLAAHHGTQDENPETLATNVKMVKACKGFSSTKYVEQDQGLVVSYLKEDGTAWYRQYVWSTQLEKKVWLKEEQIGEETWDHINVSRLNDYRLSFQLVREDKVLWLYTDQTWVGQASPPELVTLNPYLVDKDFWYDKKTYVRDLHVSEVTVTYKESGSNKYLWTVSFKMSRKIAIRSSKNILDRVTLTDDLKNAKQSIVWNEEQNSFDVDLLMNYTPSTVSMARGVFTISSDLPDFVAEYDGGWAQLGTVSQEWIVDNHTESEYAFSEEFAMIPEIKGSFQVFYKQFPKYSFEESFEMSPRGMGGSFNYVQKQLKEYSHTEESLNITPQGISGVFSYTGNNVKPI